MREYSLDFVYFHHKFLFKLLIFELHSYNISNSINTIFTIDTNNLTKAIQASIPTLIQQLLFLISYLIKFDSISLTQDIKLRSYFCNPTLASSFWWSTRYCKLAYKYLHFHYSGAPYIVQLYIHTISIRKVKEFELPVPFKCNPNPTSITVKKYGTFIEENK